MQQQVRNVVFFPMAGHFVLVQHHLVTTKSEGVLSIGGIPFRFQPVLFQGSDVMLTETRRDGDKQVVNQVRRRFWLADQRDTNRVLHHVSFMGDLNYVEDVLTRFRTDTEVRSLIMTAHRHVIAMHHERMFA